MGGEAAAVWLSPQVLLTFLGSLLLFGLILWAVLAWHGQSSRQGMAEQRTLQEAALERVLRAVDADKQKTLESYEAQLRERETQIAHLEAQVSRLRDRLASSGIMGLFGNKQRDVVTALLLENEQLHELLTQSQTETRDLMQDMSTKLLDRMEAQADQSAKAVRYKQALLSAFLQQEETRQMLDRMINEGRVTLPAGGARLEPGGDGIEGRQNERSHDTDG
jgi:predicted RNase H-like nuclease (RuvC/YqgF family)